MSTFANLQTMVENRLIDAQVPTNAEVPALVNKAIRALQDLHNFVVMESHAAFATTQGSHVLGTLPASFKELRKTDPFYIDQTGNPAQLKIASSLEEVLQRWSYDDATETGQPRILLVVPTTIGGGDPYINGPTQQVLVWPYPDGQSQLPSTTVPVPPTFTSTLTVPAGEYPILIPIWAYVPLLSGASDQNWFTDNAEDFIVAAAVAEGFFSNWDETRAGMWYQRAYGPQFAASGVIGGFAKRVINLDKSRRAGPVRDLQVRPDAYGPRGRFHWHVG